MLTVILAIISTVFILVGLAGIIIPFLPGVPLAWLGLFIFAIGTHFERISLVTTIVFFVIMLATLVLDFFAPALGAGKYKASKWGIIGASVGLLIGLFVFGFWGILFGPFLGAVVGELVSGQHHQQAIKSALGAVIGLLASTLLKVIVTLIMLGFLIASWF